jgi:hypothetical protein
MTDGDTGRKAGYRIKRVHKDAWAGVVAKIKREFAERAAREQEESPADRAARRTADATVWIQRLTWVLAAVAALTLVELIQGGADTKALVDASKKQAEAAQQFADTADDINGSIGDAVDKLDAEAKNSAAAIKATQDAMRQDQRAWIFATGFELSEEPQPNQAFTIKITFINNGKTPALDVIPLTHPSAQPLPQPLPQPRDVDWSVFEGNISKGLLPPGTVGFTVTTHPMVLTNSLPQYNSGVNAIFVQAKVVYNDAFNIPHWTTICAAHFHGTPLHEFGYCERGNDVDRPESRPKAKRKPT